jgi:hypothetical protein
MDSKLDFKSKLNEFSIEYEGLGFEHDEFNVINNKRVWTHQVVSILCGNILNSARPKLNTNTPDP